MREAVGDNIDLMVDCHARPSPAMGLLFAKALDDYGLYFLEEPCWPETLEGLAAIRAAVRTPIATGERLVGADAFHRLFEAGGCEYASSTSPTLEGSVRVAASPPWPTSTASPWRRTTRPARSAPLLRSSSASASRGM